MGVKRPLQCPPMQHKKRIAFISDIHSNLPALEAVLADIRQQGVDEIICLGDVVNVGPHPAECLEMVRDLNCVIVQGNHELYALGRIPDPDWQTCPTWSPVRWTQTQLNDEQLDFLTNLPLEHLLPEDETSVCLHASPLNQFRGYLPNLTDDEIAQRMNGRDQITLFCGHTHRPLYRLWQQSLIINIGSVGMPLDGTPEAKYIIATYTDNPGLKWQIEFRAVAYNIPHLMGEFDRVGLQEAGHIMTALFRYQMLTGQSVVWPFIHDLRAEAKETKRPLADLYAEAPIPSFVRGFLNGSRK